MVLKLDTFFYVTFVNVVRLFQWGQTFQWRSTNISVEFEYHVIAVLLEAFFSPMFGLSSSISWIKLSSLLSLIPVYLSVISNSCLFVHTHKISAIFFHVNPKSLKPSSSSLCISYLGLPCLHAPIISKQRSSSFILLLTKLSTSCIPRTKSAQIRTLFVQKNFLRKLFFECGFQ